MIELLRSIVDTIGALINFIINTILGLITFITMIPSYVSYIASLITVVPPFATIFFTAGITLTIILFLINRQEG